MNPLIGEIKAGIGGLSEAISLAEDLEGVAQQVSDLGKKELAARKAWRRKQVQVNGDYAFVDAVDEYRRVKEALDLRAELKKQAIAKWGPQAWHEIELIEARQKDEYKRLYTEDGYDREKMAQLKWGCFAAALIITMILWGTGVIREMSEAFLGG
jgi:hypothetical protein